MSKVPLVALGSFVLGIMVSFVGARTFTIVQSAFAQNNAPTEPAGPKLKSNIWLEPAEPIVPPLPAVAFSDMTGLPAVTQAIDGLNCVRCTFPADEVTYAGGNFRCEDCKFLWKKLTFKGAAWNTIVLLRSLGAFGTTQPPNKGIPFNPNSPNMVITQDERDVKLHIVSAGN